MKKFPVLILLLSIGLSACIKDDFVDDLVVEELRITTILDTLAIDDEFLFEAMYLNNIGLEEEVVFNWSSSDEEVVDISSDGLATALSLGSATISASYQSGDVLVEDSITLIVGETTVAAAQSIDGAIVTTSSYVLEGDFVFSETDTGVLLEFNDNYKASQALPGLYVYLSNNKNSIASAYEIGPVEVFTGSHNYDIENVGFNEYKFLVYFCKPFNVKVGDGTF